VAMHRKIGDEPITKRAVAGMREGQAGASTSVSISEDFVSLYCARLLKFCCRETRGSY
jgi:hypothetical protein